MDNQKPNRTDGMKLTSAAIESIKALALDTVGEFHAINRSPGSTTYFNPLTGKTVNVADNYDHPVEPTSDLKSIVSWALDFLKESPDERLYAEASWNSGGCPSIVLTPQNSAIHDAFIRNLASSASASDIQTLCLSGMTMQKLAITLDSSLYGCVSSDVRNMLKSIDIKNNSDASIQVGRTKEGFGVKSLETVTSKGFDLDAAFDVTFPAIADPSMRHYPITLKCVVDVMSQRGTFFFHIVSPFGIRELAIKGQETLRLAFSDEVSAIFKNNEEARKRLIVLF